MEMRDEGEREREKENAGDREIKKRTENKRAS